MNQENRKTGKSRQSFSGPQGSSFPNSLPPRKRDSSGRFLPSGNSSSKLRNLSGFDGANWYSTQRGYVYYPTLDSKRDLDCFSLYELRKRSRWLYNNSGFATRCIDGIANMIGALTPVPQTSDTEWNLAALKSFNNNAGNAIVFDTVGKYNFWSAQPMLTRCRLLDGDILTALTESAGGSAAVMFYEAHQVDNSSDTKLDQKQWKDGVRTNPQGRPIAYRIVTGNDIYGNFRPDDNGQRSVDITAGNSIFHVDYRRPGRLRGEPALRHAVNNLLDRSEIMAFTKTSIKNASQIGFQVVRQATFTGGPVLAPRGFGAGPSEVTITDPLTGTTKRILAENPFGSGKQVEMDPGEEIKLLLDQRPHPNQVEFLDYLARDIGAGLNCSSDILWNMAKLGGATVRYVMADAQQTLIEPMQELLADQFCSRFWVYYVAKEMKAGRLPACQDPEWWRVDWQPQQKLTVDIGRDGALYLDLHKSGLISLQRFHAQQGRNWQIETDNYLQERKYIVGKVEELGMTMDQAFPPEPGTAQVQVQESIQGDPQSTGQPDATSSTPTDLRKSAKSADKSPLMEFWKLMAIWNKTRKDEPPVTVNLPPINVEVPQPIIDMSSLKLPEQKPPIIHFTPPAITVQAPRVTVQAPEPIVMPPPIVHVAAPEVNITNEIKMPKTKSVKFIRDDRGHIQSAETEKE